MNRTIVRAKETPTGVRIRTRVGDKIEFEDIPFQNYFYIKMSDYEIFQDTINEERRNFLDIDPVQELDSVKIIFIDNFSRYKLKSKFEILKIPIFEADIMAQKRWMVDTKPELNSKGLKWVMYDIETKDDLPFEKDMRGSIIAVEPILSISYIDEDGYEFFMKNSNLENPEEGEKEILRFHEKILGMYDIILGWNSTRFDDTYMKQRAEFHGISNYNWDYINQLDYMEVVKKNLFPIIPSYSLDAASSHVLGDNKIVVFDKGRGGILNLWKKSFEGDDTLEKYNKKDVQLMFDMEKKLNFIKLHMNQADIAGCFIQDTMHNSEAWDMILLREYKKSNLLSPTKPSKDEIEKRKRNHHVAGAYTFCLNPGLHDDVDVFDFKSFYPTSATACNICSTTLLSSAAVENDFKHYVGKVIEIPEDIHTINLSGTKSPFLLDLKKNEESNDPMIEIVELQKTEVKLKYKKKYFTLEKRGIVANAMDMYIAERDKTKYLAKLEKDPIKKQELKSIENSYKTLANSGYGAMAMPAFRYFNADVANAITQFCRYIIKKAITIAEAKGFQVVQGDTDSIMFKNITKEFTKDDLEYEFYKEFDKVADQQNIKSKKFKLKNPKTGELEEKDHFIVFEHEKTFNKMISIKKKNYADLMIERDGDGNPIGDPKVGITGLECIKKDTNPLAKELQLELITDVLHEKFDEKNLMKKIEEIKNNLSNNEMDTKYLVMSKSVTKNFDEYGLPMIDSTTGLPKTRKSDGAPMFAAIPAHVKLAKRLIEEGHDIYPGDNISYIVQSQPPIVAISLEEYNKGSDFDREYYWDRIITPVMKVLFVTHPKLIMDHAELWTMKDLNEKKLVTHITKLEKKCLKEDEE